MIVAVTKKKRKTVAPHITHLVCSLVLLLRNPYYWYQDVACSFHFCLSSLHCDALATSAVLQKSCQGRFRKFQGSRKGSFCSPEKVLHFLKNFKWQHKLIRDYKRGKMVSYFLNNVAKTYLYGLQISKNIEIEDDFQSKVFFILVAISRQVASAPFMKNLPLQN